VKSGAVELVALTQTVNKAKKLRRKLF